MGWIHKISLKLILLYRAWINSKDNRKGSSRQKGEKQNHHISRQSCADLRVMSQEGFPFFPPVPPCSSLRDWRKRHWVCPSFATAKSKHSRVLVLPMSFGAFPLHPMGHTFKFLYISDKNSEFTQWSPLTELNCFGLTRNSFSFPAVPFRSPFCVT